MKRFEAIIKNDKSVIREMKSKWLGDTGVSIPEIGLGSWDYRGGVDPVRKGISLGAAFIDTAESYGTEEIIGHAIKGLRSQVFLATKVSPRNFRRADVWAAADRSLRRLQTEYIDLYQLHWPNYTVSLEETLSAMEELVDAGKIRFIGVSRFFISDLKKAQAVLRKHKIVSNQVRYSLVDRTCDPELLAYCQREHISVIAFSPLGQNFALLRSHDPENVLGQIASAIEKTPAQVALNWCIAKTGVIAIPKTDSSERVAENCGASGWQLTPEQVELLDRLIKFDKRTPVELAFRRLVQLLVQKTGHNLDLTPPAASAQPDTAAMQSGASA